MKEEDNKVLYILIFTCLCIFVSSQYFNSLFISELVSNRYLRLSSFELYKALLICLLGIITTSLFQILSSFFMVVFAQELWKRSRQMPRGRVRI